MASETTEIGHGNLSALPWSAFADTIESVPELMWPHNILVFDKMRNDAMLAGIMMALTLPIRRYKWSIDPNGARDEVVKDMAESLSLPILDADPRPKSRARDRFSHEKHLFQALLSLPYGHMYFEPVYRWKNDDPATRRLMLRKLAPRMPLTISEINVAPDGGLASIRQHPSGRPLLPSGRNLFSAMQGPLIPVNKLVSYIHDQEGGNWRGSSVLRRSYKNYVAKDMNMRLDVVRNQRTGAGVPIIEAQPNATPAEMQALSLLAQAYRAGEAAGGAIPNGAKLRLVGVEGSTPDIIASIRYHDEQMTKSVLAQFLNLGTTDSGSRSLGDSFIDFFQLAQETIANEYVSTTNEHVIEDLVDKNWGIDENAPLLTYERDDDPSSAVVDLVTLTNAGLITPDRDTETFLRDRFKLPEPVEEDPNEPVVIPTAPKLEPVAASQRAHPSRGPRLQVVKAAEGEQPSIGNREANEYEQETGVDFEAMDAAYAAALAALLLRWKTTVKPSMVAELTSMIAALDDPDDELSLAQMRITPAGAEVLSAAMGALAAGGVTLGLQEAAFQGVELDAPDLAALDEELNGTAEALATVMATSLSEAGSREALSMVGSGSVPIVVAAAVATYLNDLSDSYVEDRLKGALSRAQQAGRLAALSQGTVLSAQASERLDSVTCLPCRTIDGTRYATLEEGIADYARGRYRSCQGRDRCRGILAVAVAPPVA